MRRLRLGTGSGTQAAERRRTRPARGRRLALRWSLPGVLLLALAGAGAWAWASGWVQQQAVEAERALARMTAEAGLAVDEVLVEGRERSERSRLRASIGVARGDPILWLDPYAAKARLEALPWVARAVVERRLPGTVYVRLVERRPMALWQKDGRLSVIDQLGETIRGASPNRFARLPLVVGEGAPDHAAELLEVLEAEPALRRRVVAAVRVGGRRWNLRLNNGVDVQLPADDTAAAWAKLARIQRSHAVLERDVTVIDLRLPDQLVVRMAPGAEPLGEPQEPGEST